MVNSRNTANAMKNMFNITFPTPKIKLPRISVSGSFSLNPPSVPKFGKKKCRLAMRVAMNKPFKIGKNLSYLL